MEPVISGADNFLTLRAATVTPFDVGVWKKVPERQLAGQVEAVLRRIAWLYEHDSELDSYHLARTRLRTLLHGRMAPYGPVEHVVEYLKAKDLTPELCRSLREFQANLCEEMSGQPGQHAIATAVPAHAALAR